MADQPQALVASEAPEGFVTSRATGVPCLLPSPKWQRNGTSTPSKWSANLADRF